MENQSDLSDEAGFDRQTTQPVAKRTVVLLVCWMLAAMAVFLAVVALGIYRLGWQGPAIQKIQAVVPFPAAIVNGRIVTLRDFRHRFDAYKNAIIYNTAFNFDDPANAEVVRQQKEALLNRMITLKLEEELAQEANLSVSQEEIDKELDLLSGGSGSKKEDLDSLVATVYGWGMKGFIDEVVIPEIRERKLKKWVVQDEQINTDGYALAREVNGKLAAGADFAQLAKEYSVDASTKDLGGDLGWASAGLFMPEFEQKVFAMQAGEISDLIATPYGLHIVQVLDKSEEDGETKVHSRHILIKSKDFDEWLDEKRSQTKIWKFGARI